jgi:CHAD domain-containing protein
MLRVLEECDNTAADFSADPVHDLRVSLRRCRSMADGMLAMDPDPNWKIMKKAGKQLFQSLGNLRDVQIMMEWLDKLELSTDADSASPEMQPKRRTAASGEDGSTASNGSPPPEDTSANRDPVHALHRILKARESTHKHEARAALADFDRKQWKQWSKSLPQRSARIRPGSAVFKHLALERWTAARELHVRAMRTRSQVALHTLRIGIKRFRYIVENFLPEEDKLWSNDLKHVQDLLGEIHDLDVLWSTALDCNIFPGPPTRNAWHDRILEERSKRFDKYHDRTTGPESLWNLWRAGLPQGKQIHDIATRRMKLWAKVLDPDVAHSERVARFALGLYDGLTVAGLLKANSSSLQAKAGSDDSREILQTAALLHDVGMSKGSKKHHKKTLTLIKKHGTPLGWKPEAMSQAALVARFHCKALPTRSHKLLRDLLPSNQKQVIALSAILRLANALDHDHDGRVRRIKLAHPETAKRRVNGFLRKLASLPKNEAVIFAAEGYFDGSPTAQAVATERHLLETILRRAVLVKPDHSVAQVRPPSVDTVKRPKYRTNTAHRSRSAKSKRATAR